MRESLLTGLLAGLVASCIPLPSVCAEVSIDYLTREGDIEPFAAVAERYAPFAGAEIAWGQLSKLTWKMRVSAEDPEVRVAATMTHSGKMFIVANGGRRDLRFVPDVRGDMGTALHLYRFDRGRTDFACVGVWRAGGTLDLPAGSLILATTAILDPGGEERTGAYLKVNRDRFRGGEDDVIRHANPFIGTAWNGHTFPGAAWPFGIVQPSPDTGLGDWQHCSGYVYLDPWILGFSQTHLNGTGCSDLGDILLQPFTGDEPVSTDDFRGAKDFASEMAYPGYYTVAMTNFGVRAELTAAPHVGWHRYTFPEGKGARLLVDLQYGCVREFKVFTHVIEGTNAVSSDSRVISGYNVYDSWLRDRHVAFRIEFSRPFTARRTLPKKAHEKAGRYVLDFDLKPGEPLLAKVAISGVDERGADNNMSVEAPGWDFDAAVRRCGDAWRGLFRRAELLEGTDEEKEMFYTALYHLFIQPNDIADCDGRARDSACKIFRTRRGHHYTGLSLWDTFRAAHPFYTIVVPDRVDDFCDSMLAQYRSVGYLPVIPYFGRESFCMIGNHSVPVIVDAWLKGFRGFDGEEAFAAITNSLTVHHKLPNGRAKIKENWDVYDKYGYYPFDIIRGESVARTLECSYDDWCAAEMAKSLGHAEAEKRFRERAGRWRNVFDPSTGFMRGKDSKGNWRTPFDPAQLGHGAGLANDFTEGNSWHYTWHVLQDAPGLIAALGGGDRFATKLDRLFEAPEAAENKSFMQDVTGVIGQYCQGNEPSHHVAYLYALAGHPEKTAEKVREIVRRLYPATAGGLCGNDDCGQMSVWYVFAGLGFYPVNPCGGEFVLGAPQLKGVRLAVGGGKTFTVTAKNLSEKNKYVKSITLNGRMLAKTAISYAEIMKGGDLVFEMAEKPAADFVRLKFNNPEAVVPLKAGFGVEDLQIVDRDGDGQLDIVLEGMLPGWCWGGTYFFRNPTPKGVKDADPVFPKSVRLEPKDLPVKPTYLYEDGTPVGNVHYGNPEFGWHGWHNCFDERQLQDLDGDGIDDLIVSVAERDMDAWQNCYDERGIWMRPQFRAFVYWLKGLANGRFARANILYLENDQPLEVCGQPSTMIADWDRDGDLDLILFDFKDTITYFENTGTRTAPRFTSGRFLRDPDGERLHFELCMGRGRTVDWDRDGLPDIVFAEEDARVGWFRNTGRLVNGMPQFEKPRYFRQQADEVYSGALSCPWACDMDGDGDQDIVCGNSAGFIEYIENLSGPGVEFPRWAEPRRLTEPDGRAIRFQAGTSGSIQGPCESKWGYMTLSVADWDGDGLPDIMGNGVSGEVRWWRNVGTRRNPKFDFGKGVEVEWDGAQPELKWGWMKPKLQHNQKELLTQWRTTPVMFDWNGDGLVDLLMLDTEGVLSFFERARDAAGRLIVKSPRHAFRWTNGKPLKINCGFRDGIGCGRRKICVGDWDGDGKADIVVNGSVNAEIYLQRKAENGEWFFESVGAPARLKLDTHDPQPAFCDFNGDGVADLLFGPMDGYIYYLRNPRTEGKGE